VTKEEKETKFRYGTVSFEKRKHPRFNIDLPIEYTRTDLFIKHGRALNASEGGLLLYLPDQMEIGQPLRLKLFFTSGSELNAIEMLVEVVWMDIHLGKDWGDYRTGVRFVEISTEDMEKLKNFLRSLSSP
jgi:c-di-GMP-binding flagellar brake protein YcgR